MPEIWDKPDPLPATPSIHTSEGYLLLPDPIELRKLSGELYRVTFPIGTQDAVVSRWNDMMRMLYHVHRRLMYLQECCGDEGSWAQGYPYQGDNGAINFCEVYRYQTNEAGHITWDDENEFGPHKLGFYQGMRVMDNRDGAYGIGLLTDLEFVATGEARVTTHKPLDCTRENYLWFVRKCKVPAFPGIVLADLSAGARCVHVCRPSWSFWSSFKAIYGETFPDAAAGITESGVFCDQLVSPGVDLSQFSATCANTSCPWYSVHAPTRPTAADLTRILLARGYYLRQLQAGVSDPNYWRVGLEDFAGLGHLIGLPGTGYKSTGLYLPSKTYHQRGALYYETGATVDGFEEVLNFDGLLDKLRAASTEEYDRLGLFALMMDQIKNGPDGGAGHGNRALLDTAPGYDFESIGVRRLGTCGVDETAAISGPGAAEVQRARARIYVTCKFDPVVQKTYTKECHLEVSEGEVTITLPKWRERKISPVTPFAKTVSGSAVNWGYSDLSETTAWIDFALAERSIYRQTTPAEEPATETIDCGGNVVSDQITHEIENVASGARIGGRQDKITPGDVLTLTGAPAVHVIGAIPFGGEEDLTARSPNALAAEIPLFIRNKHGYRDRVIVSLDGASGQAFKAWLQTDPLPAAIASVAMSAAAPPTLMQDATARDYTPMVWHVQGATETAIETFEWDAVTGALVLDTSEWPSGECRVKVQLFVNVTERQYPCEDVTVADKWMDAVEAEAWIIQGGTGSMKLSLKVRKISTNTIFSSYRPAIYPESGMTWNLPSDVGLRDGDYGSWYDADSTDLEWFWCVESGGGAWAQRFSQGDMSETLNQEVCWSLHFITPPAIPRYTDIAQAKVNISIQVPVRTVWDYDYTASPLSETNVSTNDTNLSAIQFFGIWYKVTNQTTGKAEIKIVDSPISAGSLNLVTIGGIQYLRGTVDDTDMLVEVLANPPDGTGWTFALGIGGPVAPVETPSASAWRDQIYGCVDQWEGVYSGWTLQSLHTYSRSYQSSGGGLSGQRYRLADGATDAGPTWQPTSGGMFGGVDLSPPE